MKLGTEQRERLWNKGRQICAKVDTINAIVQNEFEITPDMVAEHNMQLDILKSKVAELEHDYKQTIGE